MTINTPILAARVNLGTVTFPMGVTPKIDGNRVFMSRGKACMRSGKRVVNHHIRRTLEAILPDGMDGELFCGDLESTTSMALSPTAIGGWKYYIFDYVKDDQMRSYEDRSTDLAKWFESLDPAHKRYIQILTPEIVNDFKELNTYYEMALQDGYEGLVLRSLEGNYKEGRSTVKEALMLKMKPMSDMEGRIVGRKEHVYGGMLGAFVLELSNGSQVSIGTGFTDEQREFYWEKYNFYHGQLVTFTYQGMTGRGVPKHTCFKAVRSKYDTFERLAANPCLWTVFKRSLRTFFGLNRKASEESSRPLSVQGETL